MVRFHRSQDYLQHDSTSFSCPRWQFPLAVTTIGENYLEATVLISDAMQREVSALVVLKVGSMNNDHQEQAEGIDHDTPLRPVIFFPASEARCSPPSAVLTDWLSMIVAVGVGFLGSAKTRDPQKAA